MDSSDDGKAYKVHLEAALLELHDAGVVDACSLGEDEDGQLVGVLHVLLQPEHRHNTWRPKRKKKRQGDNTEIKNQCCGAGGAKIIWDLEPEPKLNF